MKINHILFAILFTGLSLSIQAQKFGYLNSQVLLAELPEVKAADAEIQALQTQLEKKGQMMVQELENRGVPANMMKYRGIGKRESYAPASAPEEVRKGDRRVSVQIISNMQYWNYIPKSNFDMK